MIRSLTSKSIIAVCCFQIMFCNQVEAHSPADPISLKFGEQLNRYVEKCSELFVVPDTKQTTIKVSFTPLKVEGIKTSCGDEFIDFRCFESACAIFACIQTPLPDSSIGAELTFNRETTNQVQLANIQDYPLDEAKEFSIHAIPLTVLERYPALFERNYLRAKTNFVELPANLTLNAKLGLVRNVYDDWSKFFKNQTAPTREDVVAEAREILRQRGISQNFSWEPPTTKGRTRSSVLLQEGTGAPIPDSE